DPKQGFVEANVFYHPELKFQFPIPAGWQVANSPQAVQMAPKNGGALLMMTLAPGKTLEESANAVLQRYNLQALDSKNLTVNGFNAIALLADQKPDPQQQQQQQQQPAVRTLSYLIQQGTNIYHLVGVTATNTFGTYEGLFTNTMQNFKTLTDASKLNKKPERIRLKTTTTAGTLQQALVIYAIPKNRLEEIAILNGMKLTDQLERGKLIKVVLP
ncbi:MAG: hypothetical protein LH478_11255, partial [Chitinophagaceae bacterium]|nr:hypothetical protein [Chitinophagaceae bacterium]